MVELLEVKLLADDLHVRPRWTRAHRKRLGAPPGKAAGLEIAWRVAARTKTTSSQTVGIN